MNDRTAPSSSTTSTVGRDAAPSPWEADGPSAGPPADVPPGGGAAPAGVGLAVCSARDASGPIWCLPRDSIADSSFDAMGFTFRQPADGGTAIRVRRLLAYDGSFLHHEADVPDVASLASGVAVDGDDVGQQARHERAELGGLAEHGGVDRRGGL